MDNPEYEKFLLDVADNVAELVAVPENRKRFEQYSCDLGKKHAAYLKAYKRGAKRMPLDPLSRFQSVLAYDKDNPDEPPRPKIDEALAYYYFSLATIHDKMYDEGYTPIHNDSCAKQLAESVWAIIENLCVDRRFIIKTALDHVKTDLAKKPQKPTGDSVGQLIKYIDTVLDDIQQLKSCRSRNPYVDKRIRMELAVSYNETKKCVAKILAERPEIKDAPAESDDPEKYLKNTHMWCVGQLCWKNGERIGAEKTADKPAEKPAEIQQSQRTEIPSAIKLLEQVATELERWEKKYLPENAQTGKIELVEIVESESLKNFIRWLEWCKHQAEAEKIKAECTKILRWFHTENRVLSKNLDDNPFVADEKTFRIQLTDLLRSIEENIKAEFAPEKPAEAERIPSKMLGDTITIKGLTINWRVICDKLKKQLLRLRAFLHKAK